VSGSTGAETIMSQRISAKRFCGCPYPWKTLCIS
jgi:hypothetical protein